MTYPQSIAYLEQLRSVGMQMGLERMQIACAALGHPEHAYPTVHIAGTNGKGSTAHMIAAMLSANGHRTGLFSSPAVTDIRDTILVDGDPISEDDFAACITAVVDAVPNGLSEYECLTTAMLWYFQQKQVDIAVIECCLGGESDTTNIIPSPLCAVFTPVALDHTAILGSTISEITACKSGIIKPSCDVVCAPSMPVEALGVIFEKAASTASTVYAPKVNTPAQTDVNGTRFMYGELPITLSMLGAHQQENAITALTVMNCLSRRGIHIKPEVCADALASVVMPCRAEIVSRDPLILLDGAHNPHGMRALCDSLNTIKAAPITLVIGMLADKDTDECLRLLAPYCKQIFCCTPPHTTRAMAGSVLMTVAAKYHHAVTLIDDPVAAFQAAKKAAQQTPIVVGGSFYTAAAVRRILI